MKTLEEIKKEFEEKFDTYVKVPNYNVGWTANRDEVWNFIESTISQTKQELIDKVESKLYTENGFFREDDSVAPDVQGVLQDIKLQKLSNK